MKPARPARRPSIHPYLPVELYQRFKSYCAAEGATESSVVEAALKEYLSDASDRMLLIRAINRLARGLERAQRDQTINTEALATFIQMWLAHTPEIPDSDKGAAERNASRRFQKFQDFVAARVTGGQRFVDDLVDEPLADPAALAIAAEDDKAPQGR